MQQSAPYTGYSNILTVSFTTTANLTGLSAKRILCVTVCAHDVPANASRQEPLAYAQRCPVSPI